MRKLITILLILCLLPAAALAQDDHLAGEQLLYNPDFSETADVLELPVGWTAQAYAEGGAALLEQTEAGAAIRVESAAGNDVRAYQDVAVAPDTVYRLRAMVRTEDVQGGQGASLSIDNYGLDGSYCYSGGLTGTTGWTELTLYVRTGAEQTTLRAALRLGGYGMESSGTAWFCDVSLYACDEVASGTIIDLMATADQGGAAAAAPGGAVFAAMLAVAALSLLLYALLYARVLKSEADALKNPARPGAVLGAVMAAAFVLRLALSLIFVGHPTDINCFMAWGNAVATNGMADFYTSGMFADYPPGYMYICGAISWLCGVLGLSYGSAGMVFLFKLPATIADLASAYLVYRLAKRQGVREVFALTLCALLALNPAAMFISGAWGQIDSLLTLGVVGAFCLFLSERWILAGAVYGLAILFKPQALMFGPLFAAAYFAYTAASPAWKKKLLHTALAVLAALLVLFVGSLPFKGDQQLFYLVGRYTDTVSSYPYATIEAYNLPALLGLNWAPVETKVLGVPYSVWGPAFIALGVLYGVFLLLRSFLVLPAGERPTLASLRACPRREGALYLPAACMLCVIFTFGHYMHERYLFPALLLLLLAYLYERDRRILVSFGILTAPLLLNLLGAMFIITRPELRGAFYDALTRIGAAGILFGCLYLCYISFDILVRGRTHKPLPAARRARGAAPEAARPPVREAAQTQRLLPPPTDGGLRMTRRDTVAMLALTAVYAAVALVNLGTLSAPETAWTPQAAGETVTIEFPQETAVSEFWVYGNIADGGTLLLRADDGHEEQYEQLYDNMFRWHRVETWFTARTLTLQYVGGSVCLNEIAFFDDAGERIDARVVRPAGTQTALLDEQDTVPDAPSYYNGMYFDELYHARTAYEHLHGLAPYENSHPPLGKLIIAVGIAIFGMNPFGWRIMGALVGVAMLPVLYLFGKRLFKKSEYAFLCTALFAVDFMHFTQTRIATIDVYAVFFILLMYYFMYEYITMNFFVDGLGKTLRPLALSGLFFGLGAASKWTCFYAGAGLAVLFFGSLIARGLERRRVLAVARGGGGGAVLAGTPQERQRVQAYWKNVLLTLLWCCLFFLLVPFLIYFGAYLPYYLYEAGTREGYGLADAFATFWRYQEFMFSYHSGLEATHPYQSAWWEWPFTLRPMWYFSGNDASAGTVSTLTASGNPAVWWVGTLAAPALLALRASGRVPRARALQIICVGVLANYLPWVLVPRCTFIYHFFATVPFLLMGAVYLLEWGEQRYPRLARVKWIWLGVAAALFVLLYPGLSGLPVPAWWAHILKFLPGGGLMYGA